MESMVNFVASKLGELILKEAELLGGVGDQVKLVEKELKRIQCCLKDADSKQRKGDAQAENWLNELREVAYNIEDAIDTFYLQLEDDHQPVDEDNNYARQKICCCFGKLKNLGQKALKVPGLHNLAIELGDILKELEEIFKSKDKYGIKPLQDESIRREPVMMPHRRAAYEDVNETEVVGLDADKKNILKLLFSHEETPRRSVISIFGPGGLGKTTLAQIVYKRSSTSENHFQYHIMLPVSQNYSLSELLRKMLKSEPKNQDVGDLMTELKCFLNEKIRYLIILDDVWDVALWDKLQHALPDHNNGSRVLITTRDYNVAKSANPNMRPYELHLLDNDKSQDLLLRKALPYQTCPTILRDIADQIAIKCKGLPLALIVVGSILKTKNQTRSAWEKVLRTMDWHSDGKGCMDVLAMSYEEMPYYLKACFLYVASFPEDHEISAKCLIKMWIAEGFIPFEDKKTMEETAEDYLEQLFQRSMVQVSSQHSNGSFKYCRVHDLLREFAIHEAGKENFVTIFPKPEGINHPDRVTRRVSLQADCSEFKKCIGPNTRSLLWFGLRNNPLYNFSMSNNEFKLLRVIEIVGVSETELMGIDRLIHLKYLGFRNCGRLKLTNGCSLGRLKNLQTLDFRRTLVENGPPTDLWTIETLRHVMWDAMVDSPYSGPPSNAVPRNLQTLRWISGVETWQENRLPHLNKLQKLGLDNGCINKPEIINWDVVVHLFKTLSNLLSLGIRGWDIPEEIVYPKAIPNFENLETLYLEGRWSRNVNLEASCFPPYLVKLTLVTPLFEQDPMPQLGNLKSLMKLRLEGRVCCIGEGMICSSGFPVLETLHLALYKIKSFTVMEGVMPNLKHLTNSGSTELNMPRNLRQFSKYSYL
ncbi:hypothetical protein LUZ61_007663 [Rhynchospora tenuis]|uniref:Uncharacterized protein n=1 Tax=Rhynchospora tenuis TaxID=198213 RepID=A0AAD5ZU23_9POAL|nr:hypothetical protein LUZ61_007663 [Rhynchospora tenuis]